MDQELQPELLGSAGPMPMTVRDNEGGGGGGDDEEDVDMEEHLGMPLLRFFLQLQANYNVIPWAILLGALTPKGLPLGTPTADAIPSLLTRAILDSDDFELLSYLLPDQPNREQPSLRLRVMLQIFKDSPLPHQIQVYLTAAGQVNHELLPVPAAVALGRVLRNTESMAAIVLVAQLLDFNAPPASPRKEVPSKIEDE